MSESDTSTPFPLENFKPTAADYILAKKKLLDSKLRQPITFGKSFGKLAADKKSGTERIFVGVSSAYEQGTDSWKRQQMAIYDVIVRHVPAWVERLDKEGVNACCFDTEERNGFLFTPEEFRTLTTALQAEKSKGVGGIS